MAGRRRRASPELLELGWRLVGGREPAQVRVELMGRIGATGEAVGIPYVFAHLFNSDHTVALAAQAAIAALLPSLRSQDLPWLDQRVRQIRTFDLRFAYADGAPQPREFARYLDRLEGSDAASAGVIGVVAMHPNGYVREAAIARLATGRGGTEIPFLILRLNDWVGPVRKAAARALSSRLVPELADVWIANAWLVAWMRRAGRADLRGWAARIEDLLRTPPCRPALERGTGSADRFVKRISFEWLMDRPDSGLPEITRALTSGDPFVRRRALACAKERLPDEDLVRTVEISRHDGVSFVRRALADLLAQRLPALLPRWHADALLDSDPGVRRRAQEWHRAQGVADLATRYRARLEEAASRRRAIAIIGLSETGSAEDCALIAPLLTDPRARVRRACLRALAALDLDRHLETVFAHLRDPAASVAASAAAVLAPVAERLERERLLEVLERAPAPHSRKAALLVLAARGKWDAIDAALRLAADPAPELTDLARVRIRGWLARFNRSFVSPTPRQTEEIERTLMVVAASLPAKVAAEIRFLMRAVNDPRA